MQERFSAVLTEGRPSHRGAGAAIGQNALGLVVSFFVMLYLLFFLLRDGDALARRIRDAVPLHIAQQNALFRRFATVIRATVKGSIVVAIVQGALGGLIFWLLGIEGALLWGAVMAVLSLLPAVGAGLVWLPVSLYLLVTGAIWQGIVLIAFGALVISMVDNVLRPILVGGDTKIPDYLVLIATLGGITIFGVNGLVIGPVIAAMFLAAWDLFSEQRLEIEDERLQSAEGEAAPSPPRARRSGFADRREPYSAAIAPAWNGAGAARSVWRIGSGHHLSSHSENSGRSFGRTCSANSFVLYLASSLPMLPNCSSSIRWPTLSVVATCVSCSTTSSGEPMIT